MTHVCPPNPQVSCRAQGDLFCGTGRPRTFLRSTSTTIRGASGMRHSGTNRHACSCHALRHPTGRHLSLTHPIWVPRACGTGRFRRTSSRWWPPRRPSRMRASRELHLLRVRALRNSIACQSRRLHPDRANTLVHVGLPSVACEGPRGIERGRTDFRAWRGPPACGNQYMYNVECIEARRRGPGFAVHRN